MGFDVPDGVRSWQTVAGSWVGYRPEPLIAERLWCCPLTLAPGTRDEDGWLHEVGFDADGRPVAMCHRPPPGGLEWGATVTYGPDRIEVCEGGATTIVTTLRNGRPVCTDYSGEIEGRETYHYDQGRLVAIDEADVLGLSLANCGRPLGLDTGGRVRLDYNEHGLLRIVSELFADHDLVVWERTDEPFDSLLARGLASLRNQVVDAVAQATGGRAPSSATEAFRLVLGYTADSGVLDMARVGLQGHRARWQSATPPDQHAWCALMLNDIPDVRADVPCDGPLFASLVRESAVHQPEDPLRFVLNRLAALLASQDWGTILTLTDDFVVYIAEHDEGWTPKYRSMCEANPSDRVELWHRRWLAPGQTHQLAGEEIPPLPGRHQ